MKSFVRSIAICALLVTAFRADAVIVTVDPAMTWNGWMNWYELPENGGGYVHGQAWGTADLSAGFTGDVVTLKPNTSITDPPTNTYWWKPDGTGNKNMEANFYVESTALSGQELTFTGQVLENSLADPYTSVAFIKDFNPSWGMDQMITAPLVNGTFSVNANTIAGAGRHIQYGFMTIGPNARPEDLQRLGQVRITAIDPAAIPEPSTLLLFASSAVGLLGLRRNRKA